MKLSLKLLVLLLSASFCVQASAATFTVTNTGDNGGVNPAPGASTGTLRQAIVDANATSGADTITFTATGIILLASALPHLTDDVDISGPGANALTVKRDPGAAAFRIFTVDNKTVTISGLTITNGISELWGGGGILNSGLSGTLTVSNSTISGNSAPPTPAGGFGGGGILNLSGTLTINDSIISGNSATNVGGGIMNGGTLTVSNSTISGNSMTEIVNSGNGAFGGGIYNEETKTVTVSNSTISGNSASGASGGGLGGFGGGIANGGSSTPDGGTVTVSNSTISGNSASGGSAQGDGVGGGIYNQVNTVGTVTVSNSTISGNSASGGGLGGLGVGGGISSNLGGTLNLNTSIVGNNTATFWGPDISGIPASGDYNLVENDLFSPLTGPLPGTHNITGVDPMLGPLQNNGGPTFTHELMAGSPAIDKGKNMDSLTTDQRGPGFARKVDNPSIANATGGDGTDIGAFEVQGLAYAAQIQQPINADGSSVFNVRRGVVPVKFTLTLNGVATCDLPPATIIVTRTAGGTPGQIDESIYTGSADNGSNFRISSCQYIYNLSASALGVGTYRVDIMINGQVVGSGMFQLK